MLERNKKKIILANATVDFMEQYKSAPLGLAYIASCLEKENYEVRIVDSHLNNLNVDRAVKIIMNEEPDAVGLTATTMNRFNIIEMSQKIKEHRKDILVFVGGPHFTMTAEDAIRNIPAIDFVVIGEGEITTIELLNSYFSKKPMEDVKGICFRDKNNHDRIIRTKIRFPIEDLDALPMPAYHLLDIKKYGPLPSRLTGEEKKLPAVGVISSRGCPNKCIFCANSPVEMKAVFRARDPKKFVEEIQYLYEKYRFRMFNFWNDTFTMSRRHVFDVCNDILRRSLKIKWYARARVNTVDREMLEKMKEAGCITIMYGAESGSNKILKVLKKNISVEQIRNAVKLSAEAGMDVLVSFMVSIPEETEEDVKMTLDLIKELRSYSDRVSEIDISPTLIYPGTAMERISIKEGKIDVKTFSWNRSIEFDKNRQLLVNPYIPVYTQKFTLEKIMAYRLKNKINQQLTQPKHKLIIKSFKFISSIRSFKDVKTLFSIFASLISKEGKTKKIL